MSGGAVLTPQDFSGRSILLTGNVEHLDRDQLKLRAALEKLKSMNPPVASTLSCFERELQDNPIDPFPPDAGQGAMPHIPLDPHADSQQHNSDAARSLSGQGITGALHTMDNLNSASVDPNNGPANQTIGTTVNRTPPGLAQPAPQAAPAEGTDSQTSPANAVHTTLYPKGVGGWHAKSDKTQCTKLHHRKKSLASVATPFRTCEEYLWFAFQTVNKDALHGNKKQSRLVNAQVAQSATAADVASQRTQAERILKKAGQEIDQNYVQHVDVDDTFTRRVGKNVVGGKAYWHKCFLELIAMAIKYGTPPFFVTFTANERGWHDLQRACDHQSFSTRSIDATRHYHHRWQQFNQRYLKKGVPTPIGTINAKMVPSRGPASRQPARAHGHLDRRPSHR